MRDTLRFMGWGLAASVIFAFLDDLRPAGYYVHLLQFAVTFYIGQEYGRRLGREEKGSK